MNCNAGTTSSVADLWAAYAADRSTENRNAIVTRYMAIVYRQAVAMRKRMPKIDLADLISGGSVGLMRAVEAFDPACKVNFAGYCIPRIRGAMLDEVRRMDWVPIRVRKEARRLASIEAEIFAATGCHATDDQLQERLGRPLAECRPAKFASGDGLEERAHATADPSDRMQQADLLPALTRGFSDAERQVLHLRYWDSLSMREIGDRLGMSHTRVCQIHSKLIESPELAARVRSEC